MFNNKKYKHSFKQKLEELILSHYLLKETLKTGGYFQAKGKLHKIDTRK